VVNFLVNPVRRASGLLHRLWKLKQALDEGLCRGRWRIGTSDLFVPQFLHDFLDELRVDPRGHVAELGALLGSAGQEVALEGRAGLHREARHQGDL
jgi:hypothetical protein